MNKQNKSNKSIGFNERRGDSLAISNSYFPVRMKAINCKRLVAFFCLNDFKQWACSYATV